MKHIFLVDDEPEIRHLVTKYLEKEGYKVTSFSSGAYVLEEILRLSPDLLVLDIMLPGEDGLSLCRRIREKYEIPIVFVSARGDEVDRIVGLELGGDDYLAKPFSPRELVARIKNLLRRMDQVHNGPKTTTVSCGNTLYDDTKRSFLVNGKALDLTMKEFNTIGLLLNNLNMPVTRDQLLEKVWGYDFYGDERIIDDVIKRLRKKLKESDATTEIKTVWGYGYKIEDNH